MTNTTHATPEPVCCGERMVRYPGVSWECAAAYFGLKDDGVIDDLGFSPPVLYDDRATPEQRELHQHLLATRIDTAEQDHARDCERWARELQQERER